MTGETNGHDSGVKVPTGQINYNTVGASAGIASFLGLNARNLLGGCWGNNNCGNCNGNGWGWNNGGCGNNWGGFYGGNPYFYGAFPYFPGAGVTATTSFMAGQQSAEASSRASDLGAGALGYTLGLTQGMNLGNNISNDSRNHRFHEGSGRGRCFQDAPVSQIEMGYTQQINQKDSVISQLQSEKYTDGHILEAYRETVGLFKAEDEKISSVVKDVTASFIETGKELAVLNTKVQCLEERMVSMNAATNERLGYEIKGVYRDIHSSKKELEGAIALESERRCCGDKTLYEYVNGTFVPGKLIMPSTSVCPQPMPLFNSWSAPTTAAPTNTTTTTTNP